MMDVMGVSEHLKIKLTENGYTDGRVIGSGCTMCGNPVRDMHLGGGKNKITQKVIDNYIKGISTDYECKLRTFDKSDDFCVYVKLKDDVYEKVPKSTYNCTPIVDEEVVDEDEFAESCEPEAVINRRIIEINVHKNCLLDVIGRLTKYTRVHEIDITEFSASYYHIAFEYVEEV